MTDFSPSLRLGNTAGEAPGRAPGDDAGARHATEGTGPGPPRDPYWPTRPGWSTCVNSTVPSCSRSRTVSSPLSPSMSTSPKNW